MRNNIRLALSYVERVRDQVLDEEYDLVLKSGQVIDSETWTSTVGPGLQVAMKLHSEADHDKSEPDSGAKQQLQPPKLQRPGRIKAPDPDQPAQALPRRQSNQANDNMQSTLILADETPIQDLTSISAKEIPIHISLVASSYTLTNGSISTGSRGIARIRDPRWKFQDESALPPPKMFTGVPKRYRVGGVSTFPLDLGSLG